MNWYRHFITFVCFKSRVSWQDSNIASTARFLLPAKTKMATFTQISSTFLKGLWNTNWTYVHAWANSPQLSEPSVRRGRAQAPKEVCLSLFLPFLIFVKIKPLLCIYMLQGLWWGSMFLSYHSLLHIRLKFYSHDLWLVVFPAYCHR